MKTGDPRSGETDDRAQREQRPRLRPPDKCGGAQPGEQQMRPALIDAERAGRQPAEMLKREGGG